MSLPPPSPSHHPVDIGARVIHLNYRGEVDLFLVHCPETGRIYAVPVSDVGFNTTSLRVTPPASGQHKRIRWARDYELPA